jgi:hypothetical protein
MTSTDYTRSVPHGCVKQSSAHSVRRYFGEVLPVKLVTLAGVGHHSISSSTVSLQLLDASGRVITGHRATVPGGHVRGVASFQGAAAAGILVSSPTGVTLGDTVVTPTDSRSSYRLDTNFQLAVATSKWKLTSTEDTFSVFKATSLDPRAWLVAPSSGSVTKIRTAEWGDSWVSVTLNAPGALERSEAYLPGWRATAVNATTGKVEQLKVMRAGLIEKVDVPKGRWVIHFHYHAPYIEVSTAASAISVVLWLGVAGGLLIRKRRKRTAKVLT